MRPVRRRAWERAHPDKPDPITEAVTEALNRLAAALEADKPDAITEAADTEALNRLAAAVEALPPALTQATKEAHLTEMARQRHALDFGR